MPDEHPVTRTFTTHPPTTTPCAQLARSRTRSASADRRENTAPPRTARDTSSPMSVRRSRTASAAKQTDARERSVATRRRPRKGCARAPRLLVVSSPTCEWPGERSAGGRGPSGPARAPTPSGGGADSTTGQAHPCRPSLGRSRLIKRTPTRSSVPIAHDATAGLSAVRHRLPTTSRT